MTNTMKKLFTPSLLSGAALLFLFSGVVQALPIDATGGVIINRTSQTAEIIFDSPSNNGDIAGNSEGLFFDLGGGLTLTVTSLPAGTVGLIDDPANGGLGVDPGAGGDNLANGESLTFTFNQRITLTDIKFNGILALDGHQDASDGSVTIGGTSYMTTFYDGVIGGTYNSAQDLDFPDIGLITSFTVLANQDFSGYIESITIDVPEPGMLALLGIGLVGIGLRGRRRTA